MAFPPGDVPPVATLTIAVVDHTRGHRDGLSLAVASDARLRLVVEAESVEDLDGDVVASLDGLLLQTARPGIDLAAAIARVRATSPQCTVVVIVPWVDPDVVPSLRTAGAAAVLSSDAPLQIALDAFHPGPHDSSDEFATLATSRAQLVAEGLRITSAELHVLRRLGDGVPPKRIAHDLDRSVNTIRDHIRALREKLGCSSSVELVVTAYRRGLLPGLGRPAV